MIFNEQGYLDIDGMIAAEPSFQNIMDDGIVTEEELHSQIDKVINLFLNWFFFIHPCSHALNDFIGRQIIGSIGSVFVSIVLF